MSKLFRTKKKIENQQYDKYWSLTLEYIDIFDLRFNNTLRIILDFIDENREILSENCKHEKLNKELQEKINRIYQKRDQASTRKSINQFIKLGFVKPFYNGYHKLARKFLSADDQNQKRNIFSEIFYTSSSFCSSYSKDNTNRKEIDFLLKTLVYHPEKKLSKIDVIALMVTPIEQISKGYLTKNELEEQYKYASTIKFDKKKYNQINYLIYFLNLMPNISANKDTGVWFIDPSNIVVDTKRDPILYSIYKDGLDKESIKFFGKKVCYIQKKELKGLVHSHIKDSIICLSEGNIDEAYDYNNGLLLSTQVDAYFDKYDISFDNDGMVLVNDYEIHDIDILQWISTFKLDKKLLNPDRLKYLEWHRNKFKEKALKCKEEVDNLYKDEIDKENK